MKVLLLSIEETICEYFFPPSAHPTNKNNLFLISFIIKKRNAVVPPTATINFFSGYLFFSEVKLEKPFSSTSN